MNNKLIVAAIATAVLLMQSCKKESGSFPEKPESPIEQGGKEDEDRPHILHKTVNQSLQSVSGAGIYMMNAQDTFHQATDDKGESLFELPASGNWHLIIEHDNYQTLDTIINVVDSFSVKTSILMP